MRDYAQGLVASTFILTDYQKKYTKPLYTEITHV